MNDDTGRRLLERVDAHHLAYGREDSFKMAPGRLFAGRFLLGIPVQGISEQAALNIAAGIGMPEKYVSVFRDGLREANTVGFGVEESENGRIYKAYLEFWDRVCQDVRATGNKDPALLHLGFKWYEMDSTISVVSRYICYPMLDVAGILARLRRIYQECSDQTSCQIMVKLVLFAAHRNAGVFIYVEVGEEGNPRRSFDINFYKASLTLNDIRPFLLSAAQNYAIALEQLDALCARAGTKLVGHVSGGIGRDGGDFLTVYYETRQL